MYADISDNIRMSFEYLGSLITTYFLGYHFKISIKLPDRPITLNFNSSPVIRVD